MLGLGSLLVALRIPTNSPPATIDELFGASLKHVWDSYSNATGVYTDRVGGLNVDDGGDHTPAEESINGHGSPVFDGTGGNHALQTPGDTFVLLDDLDTWTMFGTVRIDGGDAYGSIIQRQAAFYVEFNTDGSLAISITNSPGSEITGTTSVEDGQWHRWILTCDAGHMKLYVDGVFDGEDPTTAPIPAGVINPLFIGRQFSSAMPGCLSLVGIATRALNPAEVALLDGFLEEGYTAVAGAAPVVSSLTNGIGSRDGGGTESLRKINGTGFTGVTGAAGVKIDGVNVASYTVNSDTEIQYVPPAATGGLATSGGTCDVLVTHPTNGASTGGTGLYEYWDPELEADCVFGYRKGSYVAGTFTAKVGTNLTEATNPPAAASGAPDFDGADDILGNTVAISTSLGATPTISCAFDTDAIATAAANAWFDAAIVIDNLGFEGVTVKDVSGTKYADYYWYDSAPRKARVAIATGKRVVQAKRDGTTLYAKDGANAWTAGDTTAALGGGGNIRMGSMGGAGPTFLDGRIFALFGFNVVKSDAYATKFNNYCKAEFGTP